MATTMIKVQHSTNFARGEVIIPNSTKISDFLTSVDIDYGRGMTTINGSVLAPGDFSKTFADLGITESCKINNVAKTDNA